ncbi:MAG: MotA/TolQ/ExbB proton channel family protein [Gammaproteobacteria bacterium]|nr:MotA/TolQ/ExbB proton channel family protein [Gammaproteobacteria bacterium]
MNKLATLLGLMLGVIVLVASMFDYQQMHFVSAFFDARSALIVVGGVMAAILINYPLNQLPCIAKGFWIAISRESESEQLVIDELLDLAIIAHRQGKLALEKQLDTIHHDFIRLGINELLMSSDATVLERNLYHELSSMQLRHGNCQELFYNMASYAPAFGMLGTVMGLIMMMSMQGNTNPADNFAMNEGNDVMQQLLSGMGVALVTTFYGVLLANFIFLPIAGKLSSLSKQEAREAEIITIGILAIQRQESPLRIKDALLMFVSQRLRDDINEQRQR